MIKTEVYETREDGNDLIRTYSSNGLKIMQEGTGDIYDEAIDPKNMNRTYVETDEPIEPEDADISEEEQYSEAGRILLGVRE